MMAEGVELHYFQFFAKDWLSSSFVTALPAELEGTYVRLLCHQWLNDGLPVDSSEIQALTKFAFQPKKKWNLAWLRLVIAFPESGDGKRRNQRLEEERVVSLKKHGQRVEAGNRSAAAKAAKKQQDAENEATERQRSLNERCNETPEVVATNLPTKINDTEPEPEPEPEKEEEAVTDPPNRPVADVGQAAVVSPVMYAQQELEVRSACEPHVSMALTALMSRHRQAYTVIYEIWACATGMHTLRGKRTGKLVQTEHVIAAIWEMTVNDANWNVSLFRGYCMRCADQPPIAKTPEERELQKVQAEARKFSLPASVVGDRDVDGTIVSRPLTLVDDTPEQQAERKRLREEAMRKMRAEFHRNQGDEAKAS